MILLQTKESSLFESAFFLLRRERMSAPYTDMMAEANRIIGGGHAYLARRRARGWILPFLAGLLLGAGVFALVVWIIS
jgi:hypothetical protein